MSALVPNGAVIGGCAGVASFIVSSLRDLPNSVPSEGEREGEGKQMESRGKGRRLWLRRTLSSGKLR